MSALRVVSVSKRYGATLAVSGASLDLERGQIHAIVGENGAGKSTLSSIAAGLVVPDEGEVEIAGERLSPHNARAAVARGVGMVQQHFRLIEALTVLENAMLGAEPVRGGRIDVSAARAKLVGVLDELRTKLDPEARVESLGVGDRQRLEIAHILFHDARVVLLDEPTAVLSPQESRALYATLRRLADGGRAIAVVTHKLDEVLNHADVVTVMRRGRVVSTRPVVRAPETLDAQRRALLHDAFHDAEEISPVVARGADEGERMLLELEGVKAGTELRGVRLHVRAKEIVGVAAVDGNGQRELVDVLAGLRAPSGGIVRAKGRIEVVHEDRHQRGLVVSASVADNAVLGEHAHFARWFGIDLGAMREEAARRVKDGEVSPADVDLPARALSGGNQQKLVLARALARGGGGDRILVLAQPTRGVDLAAARQIHLRIVATAQEGAAVLVLSADLDELRALCHRIVVLARGRVVGDVRRDAYGAWSDEATNERLGARMVEAP